MILSTGNQSAVPWGIGDSKAQFKVYIGNQPSYPALNANHQVIAAQTGDIHDLGQACGNGWRKVFNIYAKLMFALPRETFSFAGQYATWQAYRDNELLQINSGTGLMFSSVTLGLANQMSLIMGKAYAGTQLELNRLDWLSADFAVSQKHKLIVCPYFDYRQLSDIKINQLCQIVQQMNWHRSMT